MDKCPKCGGELVRDEVDIGVGVMLGPAGCPDCHWMEKRPTLEDGPDLFNGGEPRYCICADPENCTEPVPGRICRAGK